MGDLFHQIRFQLVSTGMTGILNQIEKNSDVWKLCFDQVMEQIKKNGTKQNKMRNEKIPKWKTSEVTSWVSCVTCLACEWVWVKSSGFHWNLVGYGHTWEIWIQTRLFEFYWNSWTWWKLLRNSFWIRCIPLKITVLGE